MKSLDRKARVLFRQLEKQVGEQNKPLLATYCQAFSDWEKCCDALEANGAWIETPHGAVIHPAAQRQHALVAMMLRLAKHLNLDAIVLSGEQDKWDEFKEEEQ